MKVHAPGKLILSGEHAVVYGAPALAMAVNRYVTATAYSQLLPFISFDLSDLAYERKLTLTALNQLKNRIKKKYQRFIGGEYKIRDVLQKPVELAQFVLSLVVETLNVKITQGMKICVQSDIPIGCGMGSSAATVISVAHAIAHHFGLELSSEIFYRLGLEAENMQHGYSSGLDLRVSMHGGCILVDAGQVYSRPLPTLPMYLINTGIPEATTGECVESAAHYFKTNLASSFAEVTYAMDKALQQNHIAIMQEVLRENHKLLTHIGVVPERVQQCVAEIEKIKGAAKICGAGSVKGEAAGVMLVIIEDLPNLIKICQQYHYTIMPIIGEARGVRVI